MKSIELDSWNDYYLRCMQVGGNKRLQEFMKNYGLTKKIGDRSYVYKTKALRYYRDLLRYEVKGGEKPEAPSLEEG
jgi:ADP-ribosylation factor GTPase-activating protein 1